MTDSEVIEKWAEHVDAAAAAKMYDSADVLTWPFYPITMPLNSAGQGPASSGHIHRLTWEVWDYILLDTYASYDNLPEAINHAQRLNLAVCHKYGKESDNANG